MPVVERRIVDEHPGGAMRGFGLRNRTADRLEILEICINEQGRMPACARQTVGKRPARRLCDVDERHPGALGRKAFGQCRADAAAAAGDQHCLVLEV